MERILIYQSNMIIFFSSIVPKCLAEGVISQVLPLHSSEDLSKLRKTWMQAFLKPQPLSMFFSLSNKFFKHYIL